MRGYLYLMLVTLRYKESSRAWAVALRFEPQRGHKKKSRKNRLLFCDTSIDIPPKSPFVKGGLGRFAPITPLPIIAEPTQ